MAALVAGGGWAVTLANRHTAAKATPQATPTPSAAVATATATPTPLPVPPPAGVDLLWRQAGPDVDRLEALDWSGQVVGGIALPASTENLGGVQPSGDGQRLLIERDADFTVVTAQGIEVAHVSGDGGRTRVQWSDGNHLCAVHQTGEFTADVQLITIGGSTRTVTSLHWPSGDGGPQVDLCSIAADVAVLTVSLGDDAAGHIEELKVVRLSTGAVLRDLHPPGVTDCGRNACGLPGALSMVSASGDGRLLAETRWFPVEVSTATTDIVDTMSGRIQGHVHGIVRGFSADNASVFTDDGMVNWRTGHVTHLTPDCCGELLAVHGRDVLLAVPGGPPPTRDATGATGPYPPSIIVLLHADGSRLQLACCGAQIL